MSEIYEPSEDSYLMSQTLEKEIPRLLSKNKDLKLLEVGIGSGINLITAVKTGVNKSNILGSDINNDSVKHCKSLGFNCVKSDLFSNVKGKFDLVIFNPPYLPLDEKEPKKSRIETTGGLQGNEITVKFLKQAGNHLNEKGKVFFITSSLAKNVDFKGLGYRAREISSSKMFFEKISIWECLKI